MYIIANRRNGAGLGGFTTGYDCKMLVWYEAGGDMTGAIAREKKIKGGSPAKKLALIEAMDPKWADLWDKIAQP